MLRANPLWSLQAQPPRSWQYWLRFGEHLLVSHPMVAGMQKMLWDTWDH